MNGSRRAIAGLLLGAAALTACGTTVRSSVTTGSTQSGAGDVSGIAPANANGAVPAGVTPVDSGTAKVTSDHSPGAHGVPSFDGGVSSAGAPAAVTLGPGVRADSVAIGLTIQSNNATVSSIAAAYNVQLPDTRAAYDALVSYINNHGGVGARKLRPIYYTYDSSASTADQIGQAACAHFTEDTSVFAALDAISVDSFNSCMQKRGRVMLPYGLYFGGEATWKRYPNVVAADGLPFNSAGKTLGDYLVRSGFLSKSTRVGAIVRSSADLAESYQKGFVPILARAGLKVTEAHYVRDPQAASDISGYTADISSAVLKFRSSGVDRVVFFDTGSYAALVFSQNAEQQGYRPHYGFMSLNSIVALQGSGSAAPRAQMTGAQGVSWEMNADGLATSRTRSGQQCDAIMKAAGIAATDAGTEASYLKTCQTFFLFKAAADLAGRSLNRDSFLASVDGFGSSFLATNTWNGLTQLSFGHHGGVSVYRPFAYREGCSCFAVSGAVQPVAAS